MVCMWSIITAFRLGSIREDQDIPAWKDFAVHVPWIITNAITIYNECSAVQAYTTLLCPKLALHLFVPEIDSDLVTASVTFSSYFSSTAVPSIFSENTLTSVFANLLLKQQIQLGKTAVLGFRHPEVGVDDAQKTETGPEETGEVAPIPGSGVEHVGREDRGNYANDVVKVAAEYNSLDL
jgi:hypothetical protein